MKILAIDPAPTESAWLIYDSTLAEIRNKGIWKNAALLTEIRFFARHRGEPVTPERVVIEMVESFGMPVGKEVFETVFWIGRFYEAWESERGTDLDITRISRMKVKMYLCHTSRARDSNIRQALIDRFGPPGTKKNPGVTYGISKDLWSALAVAVVYADTKETL